MYKRRDYLRFHTGNTDDEDTSSSYSSSSHSSDSSSSLYTSSSDVEVTFKEEEEVTSGKAKASKETGDLAKSEEARKGEDPGKGRTTKEEGRVGSSMPAPSSKAAT